jgi:hypothetical protein
MMRFLAACMLCLFACGGDDDLVPSPDPTEVTYGETTLVVWVNPRINDANQRAVPPPGDVREGVVVEVDGGPRVRTQADGIAVLAGVPAGARTLTLSGAASGSLSIMLGDKELRELAVSVDATGARVMADLPYRSGDAVVEIAPTMSASDINAALNSSNRIVLFRSGTYTGEYLFSGSQVTLFGEGTRGGAVTLNGNIRVNGSNNRIRGTRIAGDLDVDGSGFGMTNSLVRGKLTTVGSDAIYLDNDLCDGATLDGGGRILLEVHGLNPLPAPAGGC